MRDPFGINMPGGTQGRDPVRTPMPWDRSLNAGFTEGVPWLPLAPNGAEICVVAQKADPRSMLSLTRSLLELRRREPALNIGDFVLLPTNGGALAYRRSSGERRFTVVLDIESQSIAVKLDAGGHIVAATRPERVGETVGKHLRIEADEAVVIVEA
jgi:alpha-glucosidase